MIYRVFALINLVALVSLVAGLLQPQLFRRVMRNPGRLKVAALCLSVIFLNCWIWHMYAGWAS